MFLLIAELLVVLGLTFAAPRVSGTVAGGLFLLYATMNGLTFSTIFLAFQLGSIGEAFLLTAGTFGAMSAYATLTKKDLSGWRSFLFMGLFGDDRRRGPALLAQRRLLVCLVVRLRDRFRRADCL